METENKLKEMTTTSCLNEAYRCYQNLSPNFTAKGNDGYWILGCILDSMIDFLNLAGKHGIVSYDDGKKFLNAVANCYMTNQKQGEWYDDWAWWGNATAKVYSPDYSNLFGSDPILQNNFKTVCKQTFDFIKSGKVPYFPMDHSGYVGTFKAYNYAKEMAVSNPGQGWEQIVEGAEPVWNIGCWQAPMTPTTYNPFYTGLGPFQDSVINGLFYILTQRTLNQAGLGTQTEVDEMSLFYNNWMGLSSPQSLQPEQKLFCQLDKNAGLFRERVSIYKNGNPVNGYNHNLVWTGDQGLMLCALTELYYKQSDAEQQSTLNLILFVINGVFNYALGNYLTHYDVIMPWCHLNYDKNDQPGQAPGGDPGDYFSGTGIFMRGLLEASNIPSIKQFIGTPQIQQVLNNTLSALTDGNTYMNFIFNGDAPPVDDSHRWFNDFNKMATLVTASQLLLNEQV